MKYEFVEYYPYVNEKIKNVIGTCHIYAVDIELDIRGILVLQKTKGFLFKMPNSRQFDPDAGKRVTYPVLMFTSADKQQELWDFLHHVALPEIKKKLKPVKKKKIKSENSNAI